MFLANTFRFPVFSNAGQGEALVLLRPGLSPIAATEDHRLWTDISGTFLEKIIFGLKQGDSNFDDCMAMAVMMASDNLRQGSLRTASGQMGVVSYMYPYLKPGNVNLHRNGIITSSDAHNTVYSAQARVFTANTFPISFGHEFRIGEGLSQLESKHSYADLIPPLMNTLVAQINNIKGLQISNTG